MTSGTTAAESTLAAAVEGAVAAQGGTTEGSEVATGADGAVVTETAAETTTEAATEPTKLERARLAADKAKKISARNKQRAQADAQLRQRADQAARDAAQYREQAQRGQSLEERMKSDPVGLLKELGIAPSAVLDRAAEESTPEYKLAALQRTFAAEIAEERKSRIALEQRLAQEQNAVQVRAQRAAFYKTVSDETQFPSLSMLPTIFVEAIARDAYQRAVAQGYTPTDSEVLETLEEHYASHSKKGRSTTTPGKGAPTASGANAKASPAAPRTIASGLAAKSGTAPPDYEKLSDWEQTEFLARMLEANSKK